MQQNSKDDFNPIEMFKTTLDKIDRPDLFAEVFCNAAAKQVDIKECLGKLIKEKISSDKDIKEKVKDIMKEIQRDNFRFLFSAFMWVLTSATSAGIGAIITAIAMKSTGN